MKIIILVFVLIVIGFLSYMLNRDKIKSRLREKQDNRSDYNLGLQAFNKGDYETALFFFNEICKKKNGKLFRDSYEMRKKSEQALKAQYEEQRKNNLAEIEELYHNGRYEECPWHGRRPDVLLPVSGNGRYPYLWLLPQQG